MELKSVSIADSEGGTDMNWVTAICGVVMVIAPFLFGYSGNPTALWTSLIIGIVIAVLGYLKSYKWTTAAGILTLLAGFVLGYSGVGAAASTYLAVGSLVTLLAGYQVLLSEEAKLGEARMSFH
jgi:hypothetical protein